MGPMQWRRQLLGQAGAQPGHDGLEIEHSGSLLLTHIFSAGVTAAARRFQRSGWPRRGADYMVCGSLS